MTHETTNPYQCTQTNSRAYGQTRVWRILGIFLIAMGWGAPLLAFFSGIAMPAAFQAHWIRLSLLILVAVTGLIGNLMLFMSTPYVKVLRRFRRLFLVAGWGTTLSIAGLGLMVDHQPPGSALAIFISLTGVLLGPLAILGLAAGLLGLMLLIPTLDDQDSCASRETA